MAAIYYLNRAELSKLGVFSIDHWGAGESWRGRGRREGMVFCIQLES